MIQLVQLVHGAPDEADAFVDPVSSTGGHLLIELNEPYEPTGTTSHQ